MEAWLSVALCEELVLAFQFTNLSYSLTIHFATFRTLRPVHAVTALREILWMRITLRPCRN